MTQSGRKVKSLSTREWITRHSALVAAQLVGELVDRNLILDAETASKVAKEAQPLIATAMQATVLRQIGRMKG